MIGAIMFRVRQFADGWRVEGAAWSSEPMTLAAALELAEGMAKVLREVGEPAGITIVSSDGAEEPWAPG
jgi:hypothetical protein